MTTAIYPGSFDPFHMGHLDIVQRASRIFEQVVVAVAENPGKSPWFDLETRTALCQASVGHLAGVRVTGSSGLTVAFARAQGAQVILRGLRAVLDFDYEVQMAMMNRHLDRDMETFFLLTSNRYSYLSSSLIKQLVEVSAPVADLVPVPVHRHLMALGQHRR